MSFGRMDLNLLKVFDAIYEERNLVVAGKRLNLTQSAVSHALGRLRELVGDELFMRTGKGMIPTGRAAAMAPALRDALRQIQATLGVEPFSAQESKRRFVIAANDHLTAVIIAPLSRELEHTAPGVDLVIRPSTRLDLAEQIDLGRIDLAIGIFAQVPGRLNSRTLMSQGEAILMRKGHPASRRKLSLRDMTRFPLVTLSVGGQEEGAVGGFFLERGLARQSEMFDRQALEEALRELSEVPRTRVTVPHSLAIPELLRDTDMLSIVPASLAVALAKHGDLLRRPPPYPAGTSTIRAVWHRRDEHDVGHNWLREMVANAARLTEEALG
ncbi:LysR substrate-binding domain-containing protein [Variovorax ginsengisoli]|uniref:LysR substrate-binding domain-containing protein n=1 Tax=Variovorax ginsengisoli TaxID=363844 RepID=A0ABT8S6M4_9BURK|nr:LysR substrate-binding domain-containing protein [Variovorax ginsengisoli]MDN8614938.1 LysR substrate-binding domain-containing protein [Variovorax ginsengisoli]MDO1534108.1 LysR substrate-binding domain-containing protein [Variovorax ginsengisoli]